MFLRSTKKKIKQNNMKTNKESEKKNRCIL